MALVNIGVSMATEGLRVLLVDWDLEAPGLEVFFRKAAKLSDSPGSKPGIVDLLHAHAQGNPIDWHKCLLSAAFLGKSIDILSAGQRTDDYRRRVQQLNWDTLFRECRIGNYIDRLREEWRSEYDFILVDSRTGISDIGDICTVILPDVLVLLFVSNHQNVEGIESVVERTIRARSKLPVNRNKLVAVPLAARDERDRESDKFAEWREIYAKRFSDLYREWLPKEVEPLDAMRKIYVPYFAKWSFGESIPVLESPGDRIDPASIVAAYARIAGLLSHRLDWSAVETKVTSAEATGQRVALSEAREEAREAKVELHKTKRHYQRVAYASTGVALASLLIVWLSHFFEAKSPLVVTPLPPPNTSTLYAPNDWEDPIWNTARANIQWVFEDKGAQQTYLSNVKQGQFEAILAAQSHNKSAYESISQFGPQRTELYCKSQGW